MLGLIFLGIIIILISIFVLSIKYFRANAKLNSYKSFDKAAKERAGNIRYKDPKITCDYCGAQIDTSVHKVCPVCQGEYGSDKEWQKRYELEPEWADKNAEKYASQEINKVRENTKKLVKKLRISIITLFLLMVAFIVVGILFHRKNPDSGMMSTSSEELNDSKYYHYEKMAEDIENGNIIDAVGVKVDVIGVYEEKEFGNIKIGYHISNKSEEKRTITYYGISINDYVVRPNWSLHFITLASGEEIDIYDKFYDVNMPVIEQIKYGNVSIKNGNYEEIFTDNEIKTVKTTAFAGTKPTAPEGETVFTNDYIDIIQTHKNYEKLTVAIVNKSDYNFTVESDKGKRGENIYDIYFLDNYLVPSGSILIDCSVGGYEKLISEAQEGEQVGVNFSFKFSEYPEADFSTGYVKFELNK